MLYARVALFSLLVLGSVAHAKDPEGTNRPSEIAPSADGTEAPRPSRHRGLKIALGVVGGVVLIGGIVAIGIVNASSTNNNQPGYNDWGSLVVMRH